MNLFCKIMRILDHVRRSTSSGKSGCYCSCSPSSCSLMYNVVSVTVVVFFGDRQVQCCDSRQPSCTEDRGDMRRSQRTETKFVPVVREASRQQHRFAPRNAQDLLRCSNLTSQNDGEHSSFSPKFNWSVHTIRNTAYNSHGSCVRSFF